MKISIENFKSIKKLKDFELRPFTILSGVNSSGKSSFIQLLLLLKQTVELNSANRPIFLDGELYKVTDFKDIVFNHDLEKTINVSFVFNQKEILELKYADLDIYKNNNPEVLIGIKFIFKEDFIVINEFEIKMDLEGDIKKPFIKFNRDKINYLVKTNDNFFGTGIWNEINIADVSFLSFYPLSLKKYNDPTAEEKVIKLEWIKKLINVFFENVFYIGPDRKAPQEEYVSKRKLKNVSHTGDNVAQILENYANTPVQYFQIVTEPDASIKYKATEETLVEAVKYWMCEIFDVADELYANKIGENYKIELVSKTGLPTNIRHVGFGISQLLPIVVEGLRMQAKGILIVEQPEIHLHPKLQSLLFDFLYSLTLQEKKVLVETHSSHFITRMRRRIAEDDSNKMDDRINLTFIEGDIFRTIKLDDFGILDYYPEDFIEPSNSELRAIVKAQTSKRRKNA